jgi:hypothetical protein
VCGEFLQFLAIFFPEKNKICLIFPFKRSKIKKKILKVHRVSTQVSKDIKGF